MIRIKLLESHIHRNETTFRPFLFTQDLFRDVGIEFTESDDYDFAWVGQASIIDKKKSLQESIDKGLEFISKITGDYMIVDGQDSTSLIGTIDVFRESNALLFLKNSYLNDFNLYKKGWVNGRMYWGKGSYSTPDIDDLKLKMKLTGCNWLNTLQPNWYNYDSNKEYDVSCMFGYPTKETVYEHGVSQTDYYDPHRKTLFDTLGNKYKVAGLVDGQRVSQDEYYRKMYNSKIIMSPLGYGEMALRDIEATMFGSVLIKPDVSYIDSKPFVYEDGETYIACKYDWSDLEEKIDYVLSDYDNIRNRLVENMRKEFEQKYTLNSIAEHIYEMFLNLNGVSVV